MAAPLVTDDLWERIEPLLPNRPRGRPECLYGHRAYDSHLHGMLLWIRGIEPVLPQGDSRRSAPGLMRGLRPGTSLMAADQRAARSTTTRSGPPSGPEDPRRRPAAKIGKSTAAGRSDSSVIARWSAATRNGLPPRSSVNERRSQ